MGFPSQFKLSRVLTIDVGLFDFTIDMQCKGDFKMVKVCLKQVNGDRSVRKFRCWMFILLAAACLITVAGTPAHATEGGGGAYPNGAEDFMSGAVPPPGTYFINYFDYYSADRFAGKDGKGIIPGFKLNVTADVLRFIHVTDKQVLGGFWGFHLFVPFMNVDVETKTPLGNDSKAGLGDIIIDPFILSWHGKNWHAATGIDIYVPTGSYDEDDLANIGRNYWTFEPILAGTVLTDSGFEVSAKLMYDFNTRNNDASPLAAGATKYLSGQEFHMDYTVAQKIADFNLGLAGYYYQQVTDDEADGVTVRNSKGRVVAFGPAIKYAYKNMALSLKYQFETLAENRPEGNNLWFKFIYAF